MTEPDQTWIGESLPCWWPKLFFNILSNVGDQKKYLFGFFFFIHSCRCQGTGNFSFEHFIQREFYYKKTSLLAHAEMMFL